jgi:hypothetical protein
MLQDKLVEQINQDITTSGYRPNQEQGLRNLYKYIADKVWEEARYFTI